MQHVISHLLSFDVKALTIPAVVGPGVIGHAILVYQVSLMFAAEGFLMHWPLSAKRQVEHGTLASCDSGSPFIEGQMRTPSAVCRETQFGYLNNSLSP